MDDVLGKAGTVAPAQIVSVVPKVKTGIMIGFTVKVKFSGNAHKPAVGVNVYVPEFILSVTAGLQAPMIPLADVVGNVGAVAPSHILIAVPKLNVGVTFGFTVTANVVGNAQSPAVGVKT